MLAEVPAGLKKIGDSMPIRLAARSSGRNTVDLCAWHGGEGGGSPRALDRALLVTVEMMAEVRQECGAYHPTTAVGDGDA